MTRFYISLQTTAVLLLACTIAVNAIGNEPSEIAVGTLSCKAEWNEYCEDQKTVSVPADHRLCKHNITIREQSGESSYNLVSADAKSVTVKFSAKGNRDRFKQQSANIVLLVSLLGVRDTDACYPGEKPGPAPEVKPESKKTEPAIISTAAPATETITAPATEPVVSVLPKLHACACSQWIDAGKVTHCLETGRARDNVSCDSFAVTIQCVTSREECREIQKDDCYQVMGLNQTTSQKRIFVADSPYCHAQIKK